MSRRRKASSRKKKHAKPKQKPQQVYWPRELKALFGESALERVKVAISAATWCSYCGDPLNGEDLTYQCISTRSPAEVRKMASTESNPDDTETFRVYTQRVVAHARCASPAIIIGDVKPPSESTDGIWRVAFTTGPVKRPLLALQPSGDIVVRTEVGTSTLFVEAMLHSGFRWAAVEPLTDEAAVEAAASEAASGTGVIVDRGEIKINARNGFNVLDADLREGSEFCTTTWHAAVAASGKLLLVAGTGMSLPMEGEASFDGAIELGKLVWGWVDVTVVSQRDQRSG